MPAHFINMKITRQKVTIDSYIDSLNRQMDGKMENICHYDEEFEDDSDLREEEGDDLPKYTYEYMVIKGMLDPPDNFTKFKL